MKKIITKFAILGALAIGIFFTTFNSSSQVSAATATPKCNQCAELANECNTYEEGSPGYNWCIRRAENCYRICTW